VRWLSTSLFEGEVWKQEIEHLGFKAQYSNIYGTENKWLYIMWSVTISIFVLLTEHEGD
jgi:hypothetical protein